MECDKSREVIQFVKRSKLQDPGAVFGSLLYSLHINCWFFRVYCEEYSPRRTQRSQAATKQEKRIYRKERKVRKKEMRFVATVLKVKWSDEKKFQTKKFYV